MQELLSGFTGNPVVVLSESMLADWNRSSAKAKEPFSERALSDDIRKEYFGVRNQGQGAT